MTEMLSNPAFADMHEDLAETYICNMVFDDEGVAKVRVTEIFPDTNERHRLAQLLKPFDEDTAGHVRAWLMH